MYDSLFVCGYVLCWCGLFVVCVCFSLIQVDIMGDYECMLELILFAIVLYIYLRMNDEYICVHIDVSFNVYVCGQRVWWWWRSHTHVTHRHEREGQWGEMGRHPTAIC